MIHPPFPSLSRICGNGYHGLCGGNNPPLPNGFPVASINLFDGSCYPIRVPGHVPIIPTPEEASVISSAGLRFDDYALLSGTLNPHLYLKPLGVGSWLYCTPGKKVWLVNCPQFANSSKAPGSAFSGDISFKRFGYQGPDVIEQFNRPWSMVDCGIGTIFEEHPVNIEDISSTGGKVIIGIGRTLPRNMGSSSPVANERGYDVRAFLLLEITGETSADITVNITVLRNYSQMSEGNVLLNDIVEDVRNVENQHIYTVSETYNGDIYTKIEEPRSRYSGTSTYVKVLSQHFKVSWKWIAGMCFDETDTPIEAVLEGVSESISEAPWATESYGGQRITTIDTGVEPPIVQTTDSIFINVESSIHTNITNIWTYSIGTQSVSFSTVEDGSGYSFFKEYGSGTSYAHSIVTITHPLGNDFFEADSTPSGGGFGFEIIPVPPFFSNGMGFGGVRGIAGIMFVRLTNKCYLIWAPSRGITVFPTSPPDSSRYFQVITPLDTLILNISGSPQYLDEDGYLSYKPIRRMISYHPIRREFSLLRTKAETPNQECWF